MKLSSILLILGALCSFGQEFFTQARWIYHQESFTKGLNKPRYYRKNLDIKEELEKATLWILIDDRGFVRLDGKPITEEFVITRNPCFTADVTQFLTPGKHALAFNITNMAGKGGLIARLQLEYKNNDIVQIVTDKSWKTSADEQPGWMSGSTTQLGHLPGNSPMSCRRHGRDSST